MPREADGASTKMVDRSIGRALPGRSRAREPLELTNELRDALLPWLDLDEVGPVGLQTWLLSIVPALPRPTSGDHVLDRDSSRGSLEERLNAMARALADCAGDRARKNFQAAEYFRENQVLVRRLKALEAMIRTRVATGKLPPVDLSDAKAEAATHRYLPPKGGAAR